MPHAEQSQTIGLPGIRRAPPVLLMLGGIGTVQIGAAMATKLFSEVGASGASLVRVALAALVLGALWRPSLRGRSPQAWRAVWLFGATLGLMNLSFYNALDRLPLGTAVTVEFVGPLGLAVWLSRRRADYALAVFAAVGVLLLSEPWGNGIDGLGLLLALVAGACWAAYILAARRAARFFSGGDGVAIAMAIAVLPPLVPGLATGGSGLLSTHVLLLGLLVAILSSAIPYTLETEALRRIDERVFGVLTSLEPAVAAIAGWLIIDQRLGAMQLAGIACVTAASVGVTRTEPEPEL